VNILCLSKSVQLLNSHVHFSHTFFFFSLGESTYLSKRLFYYHQITLWRWHIYLFFVKIYPVNIFMVIEFLFICIELFLLVSIFQDVQWNLLNGSVSKVNYLRWIENYFLHTLFLFSVVSKNQLIQNDRKSLRTHWLQQSIRNTSKHAYRLKEHAREISMVKKLISILNFYTLENSSA